MNYNIYIIFNNTNTITKFLQKQLYSYYSSNLFLISKFLKYILFVKFQEFLFLI